MTPEKARELLEAATPGPWLCVGEDDEYPRVARVGYMDITNDAENYNARLIAAAPDLAEIVAGLRYEYLFQVNDRGWLRENDEGRFVLTGDPMRALRHYHPGVAAAIAKGASERFGCACRVVRRLVGEPEAVE